MLRYLMPAHTGLNPQDVSREGLKLGAQPIVLYGRGGAGTGNGCRAVGCGGKNRPGNRQVWAPKGPNGKKHSRSVYDATETECEEKLAELIRQMKTEIAEAKRLTSEGNGRRPWRWRRLGEREGRCKKQERSTTL